MITETRYLAKEGETERVKTTPKKFAQKLIMDGLAIKLGYWEESADLEGMTEGEIREINAQLQKEADRIAKRFGYKKAWRG